MVVFVDTSAIYALANAADANHHNATVLFRSALDVGEDLLIHNYILIESAALLHRRLGWGPTSRFLRDVAKLRVRWVDDALHRAAVERFAKRRGRVSLVDEVSFQVMREGRIDQALAFDEDFLREGFRYYSA